MGSAAVINIWITGVGVIVNAIMTGFIIRISRQSVEANKRSAQATEVSAKAATESANSANQIYELSKEELKLRRLKLWYL